MSVTFDPKSAEIVKDALEAQIKTLEQELAANPVFKKIKELQTVLGSMKYNGGANEKGNEITLVFNASWDVPRKAAWVLSQFGKPLTTTEIVDAIMKKDPNMDRRKLMSNVSGTLGGKAKDNKTFFKQTNAKGELEYGLIEWK